MQVLTQQQTLSISGGRNSAFTWYAVGMAVGAVAAHTAALMQNKDDDQTSTMTLRGAMFGALMGAISHQYL